MRVSWPCSFFCFFSWSGNQNDTARRHKCLRTSLQNIPFALQGLLVDHWGPVFPQARAAAVCSASICGLTMQTCITWLDISPTPHSMFHQEFCSVVFWLATSISPEAHYRSLPKPLELGALHQRQNCTLPKKTPPQRFSKVCSPPPKPVPKAPAMKK